MATDGDKALSSEVRLLVISYTFPPDAEVGGLRISRLCRYLPNKGIRPIVVSVEERFYDARDSSLNPAPNLQVFRTPEMLTPRDYLVRAKRVFRPKGVAGASGQENSNEDSFLRRHLLALINLPDRHAGWYLPAVRTAQKLISEEKIDAIFSSGPPWTPHLVARHLKNEYRLPWIADFRDPWGHFLAETSGPAWQRHILERLEALCIQAADLVLCTTARLRQAFQGQYAALDPAKFRTLTNGYDTLNVPSPQARGGKRLFLHLGSLYGGRRADTFIQAIAQLTQSGKLDARSFELVFQGDNDPAFIEAIEQTGRKLVDTCIKVRPRADRTEAHQLLWTADRLLLFQGDHRLQVPAKFYEYLQTGIPIFAVSEEGALTDVLTSTRSGLWVSPEDPNEIAERFPQALQLPRIPPESVQQKFDETFHFRHLASQLADWIRELLQNPRYKATFAPYVKKT